MKTIQQRDLAIAEANYLAGCKKLKAEELADREGGNEEGKKVLARAQARDAYRGAIASLATRGEEAGSVATARQAFQDASLAADEAVIARDTDD